MDLSKLFKSLSPARHKRGHGSRSGGGVRGGGLFGGHGRGRSGSGERGLFGGRSRS
jgi:hypothetical protein